MPSSGLRSYGTDLHGSAGHHRHDNARSQWHGRPALSTTATSQSERFPAVFIRLSHAPVTLASTNLLLPVRGRYADATSETTVPASGTTCNGVYTGTFSGNITVSSGQNCIFEKGGVTGNITETGGNLALSNATVGGNIVVSGGTYSIGPSTTIKGNLTVQSIPTGAAQNQICGTTRGGQLMLQSVGTAATIGSGTPSCPGNTIAGSVTLQANSAAVAVDGNTIKRKPD